MVVDPESEKCIRGHRPPILVVEVGDAMPLHRLSSRYQARGKREGSVDRLLPRKPRKSFGSCHVVERKNFASEGLRRSLGLSFLDTHREVCP